MDSAARLPDTPQHCQDFSVRSSGTLWSHFIILLNFLLLRPLKILLDTVLAYRYVYILSVHDPGRSSSLDNVQSSAPHHQVIGVYASAEAARVAMTEVLQLPEYQARAINMGFPKHGKADLGTRIGCESSMFEAGKWHNERLVLLVERMVVRRKGW